MTLEQFTTKYESVPGAKVSGVFRAFEYDSVQLWYFTPIINDRKDAPTFPLLRGYYIGTCFHLGSLAFGSLVVTLLSVVRLGFGTLAQAAEGEGNPCLLVLAKCLFCCVSCYERCIEFLNKNAYMDIAINSTTFCTAAQNALQIIGSEISAVAFLNGATWIFKIAGYALITGSGTFLVW